MLQPSPASAPVVERVLAGAVGALVLLVATVLTAGLVVPALLGLAAAWLLARRRRRPLGRGAGWLGSVTGAALGIALVLGVVAAAVPSDTMRAVRRAAEEAAARESARQAAVPAWLQRAAPAAARPDPMTTRLIESRAFQVWTGLAGAALACTMLGALVGTVAWGGAACVGYAAAGRWPASARASAGPWGDAEADPFAAAT